jgi:HD-like signal output (HDOD) protein
MDWANVRKSVLGEGRPLIALPKIRLPALPRSLTQFCRRADNDKASINELAAIIQADAALTCELLKHVNSSQFSLRKKASTAQQALSLIGIKTSKMLLMTAGAKLALAGKQSRLINLTDFWNANLERALFAKEVAVLLRADADVAFAGAMLQDFLLPALIAEMEETYAPYIDSPTRPSDGLAAYEERMLGWNHAQAGGQVMLDWKFPDDILCTVLYHDRGLAMLCDKELGRTAVAAVALSSLLPDGLGQSPVGFDQLQKLQKVWPAFRLNEIADRIAQQFAEQAPGVTYPYNLKAHCDRAAQPEALACAS